MVQRPPGGHRAEGAAAGRRLIPPPHRVSALTELPAWRNLAAHRRAFDGRHLRELFAADAGRFDRFSLRFNDILFDYSKNRITGETMELLVALTRQTGLAGAIEAMFGRRQDQQHRTARGAARRAAQPVQPADRRGRRRRDARGQPGARQDALVQRARALRRLARLPRRRDHPTWSTSASAAPISDPGWW